MQFKLAKTYRYWWPVTVHVPDPDNAGQLLSQDFRVQLEPLPQDELTAEIEEGGKLKTYRESVQHGVKQLKRVVRNWDGVIGEDGNPVPFSPEMLVAALQHAWFRAGINRALTDSQNGEKAREGN